MSSVKRLHIVEAAVEPMSLADATLAREAAEAAFQAANDSVEAAARAWPAPMERRYLLELTSTLPHEANDATLTGPREKQRAALRAFDKAIKSEDRARVVLDLARKTEAELKAAADAVKAGDGRNDLAAAIAAVDEAEKQKQAHGAAAAKASAALQDAQDAVDDAEHDLKQAGAEIAAHMQAEFYGDAGEAPKSLVERRSAIQSAKDRVETCEAVLASLEQQAGNLNMRLALKEIDLSRAIKNVVRTSAATAKLVTDFTASRDQYFRLKAAAEVLAAKGMLPDETVLNWSAHRADEATALAWSAAIETLKTDAAAVLPEAKR